jgi:hypothetical protein
MVKAEYIGIDASGMSDVTQAIEEGDNNLSRLFQPLFRTPLKMTMFSATRKFNLDIDAADRSGFQVKVKPNFSNTENSSDLASTAAIVNQGLIGKMPQNKSREL